MPLRRVGSSRNGLSLHGIRSVRRLKWTGSAPTPAACHARRPRYFRTSIAPLPSKPSEPTKVATTENNETHALSSTGDLSPGYCTFLLSLDEEVVGGEARRAASSGNSKGWDFHRLVATVADSPQLDRKRTAQSSDWSSTAKIRGLDRAGPNVSQ